MSYKIAVLPGDGIGLEVMTEATQVLKQSAKLYGFGVELEDGIVGEASPGCRVGRRRGRRGRLADCGSRGRTEGR